MAEKHTPAASLLDETRQMLRQYDLRARKGLAQHFLISRHILDKITAAADLSATDTVLEIGPGLGILTKELVRQSGQVNAVELDNKLADILKTSLAGFKNFSIINRDILEIEPGKLLEEQAHGQNQYKVVANLPYYITSAVIRHFLEATVKPTLMVIMVQKEIAQAITAKPGELSLLAISVQFYGQPRVVTYVPAECFYPAPKVESAVLRIDLYPKPLLDISNVDGFFRLVRAGFTSNRKQIANSLALGLGLPKNDLLPLLEKAGIDNKRRAETLSIEEWGKLYQTCIEAAVAED
jgi:16S rRNA (adenine1518-N6/adenine1519-N6)-dimethyltransferase